MFVPDYNATKDDYSEDVKMIWETEEWQLIEFANGKTEINTFIWELEPLMLKCPYCNTEIHQAWYVSCECGLQMEAISEGMHEFLKTLLTLVDNTNDEYTRYETLEMDFKIVDVHHLNGLNWLEIKEGGE